MLDNGHKVDWQKRDQSVATNMDVPLQQKLAAELCTLARASASAYITGSCECNMRVQRTRLNDVASPRPHKSTMGGNRWAAKALRVYMRPGCTVIVTVRLQRRYIPSSTESQCADPNSITNLQESLMTT